MYFFFPWFHLCIIRVQVDTWSDSHFLCDNSSANTNQFVFVKCATTVGFLLPVHTDSQNVWIVICKINYTMKMAYIVALWCDPTQYSVTFWRTDLQLPGTQDLEGKTYQMLFIIMIFIFKRPTLFAVRNFDQEQFSVLRTIHKCHIKIILWAYHTVTLSHFITPE